MADGIAALLTLALTPGLGPRKIVRLLEVFGTAEVALRAAAGEWPVRTGLPRGLHRAALRTLRSAEAERVLRECAAASIALVGLGDPDYPPRLATIYDPPAVLYARGRLPAAAQLEHAVAIVGTRKASDHGMAFTHRLAAELADRGVCVVSGLALGIDAEAHRGVVAAGGCGVAVLPGGLDRVHPAAHASLAEALLERGCLLSEQPPGTALNRGHFVARNRLLSGLVPVVAVVEAGVKSGALITATSAADEGRTVLAMPGRPGDPRTVGTLALLKEGAMFLTCSADVLSQLGIGAAPPPAVTADAPRSIAQLLSYQSVSFDALLAASGLSAPELSAQLGRLELDGRARRGADGCYYLIRD